MHPTTIRVRILMTLTAAIPMLSSYFAGVLDLFRDEQGSTAYQASTADGIMIDPDLSGPTAPDDRKRNDGMHAGVNP
jgi:hypothetical protein